MSPLQTLCIMIDIDVVFHPDCHTPWPKAILLSFHSEQIIVNEIQTHNYASICHINKISAFVFQCMMRALSCQ